MKSKYPVRAVNGTGDKTIDVQVLVVPDSAITAGSGTISLATATGDVTGPSSSTDNAIARFDSTTGKVIQNSTITVSDTGTVAAASGTLTLTSPALVTPALGTPASGVLTSCTVATAAANDNDTSIASTAFVQGQGQGYLVYDATLTQTSTNAPVATVGQNNIGQTMTWAYVSPGVYTVTAGAAAFTAGGKTQIFMSPPGGTGSDVNFWTPTRTSTTVITLETRNADISAPGISNANALLTETAIRIVIFP